MNSFIASEKAVISIHVKAMSGIKVPHKVSLPVLRRTNDGYDLAAFVFLFSAEQLKKGEINRPSYWVTADISTGTIFNRYDCRKCDFSNETFDKKYSINETSEITLNGEFYNKLYALLDTVRKTVINDKRLNVEKYDEYLSLILKTIPQSYRVFYKELSNV